jgi:hypothetical protein
METIYLANGNPTICAKCRYFFPNPYGWSVYESDRCWHGCRHIERIDFVTGQKSYPWDTYPVECRLKNDGHCPDYEYDPKAEAVVCIRVDEPKKHWWQR